MALWFRDGFEFYNQISDAALGPAGYGIWNTASTFGLSTFTRFGLGQSLNCVGNNLGNLTSLTNQFSNQATVFAGCSFINNSGFSGGGGCGGFRWYDGSTVQCSVLFAKEAGIPGPTDVLFYRGDFLSGGTLLATYAAAGLNNQWNQYQFKIVLSGTVGEFHVRKNGATSDSFVATGLNNITTANSYANGFNIQAISANPASQSYIDDFACWDSTGSAPWNNWVGDFRIIQSMAISDNSVQMTQTNSGSTTFGNSSTASSSAKSANQIYLIRLTPTCGGTLGNVTVGLNAGFTGHMNAALYDSNGDNTSWDGVPTTFNQPGTLLAQCSQVTNPSTGNNTLTWSVTPTIQNGHVYYLAIWTDTAFTWNGGNSLTAWQYGLTYNAVFPATLQHLGSTQTFNPAPDVFCTITPLNSGMVSDFTQDGGTTYVSDSVVSDQDLYGIQPLPVTPSAILGVDFVGMIAKSDAGSRGAKFQITSGSTNLAYTEIFPNTTFNFYRYQQDLDPNTSAAWTPTGVNALLIGQKITT